MHGLDGHCGINYMKGPRLLFDGESYKLFKLLQLTKNKVIPLGEIANKTLYVRDQRIIIINKTLNCIYFNENNSILEH